MTKWEYIRVWCTKLDASIEPKAKLDLDDFRQTFLKSNTGKTGVSVPLGLGKVSPLELLNYLGTQGWEVCEWKGEISRPKEVLLKRAVPE